MEFARECSAARHDDEPVHTSVRSGVYRVAQCHPLVSNRPPPLHVCHSLDLLIDSDGYLLHRIASTNTVPVNIHIQYRQDCKYTSFILIIDLCNDSSVQTGRSPQSRTGSCIGVCGNDGFLTHRGADTVGVIYERLCRRSSLYGAARILRCAKSLHKQTHALSAFDVEADIVGEFPTRVRAQRAQPPRPIDRTAYGVGTSRLRASPTPYLMG